MLKMIALLVAGETALLAGLWLAWPPVALVALGGQLIAVALLRTAP